MGRTSPGPRARGWPDRAGARGCWRRTALARHAHGGGRLLAPRDRCYLRCRQTSPGRARPQRPQAGQHPVQRGDPRGAADGVRHRLEVRTRTSTASPSRDDRRYARLHGARTDRTDESVCRFPQRPLRARRHVLPNAHRCPAVYRCGSDGMGALPPRQAASAACRAAEGIPAVVSAIITKLLAKRAEDRYQTAAALESDLCSCQTEWIAHRRIDDFPLGEHDMPDRLLIPEKLYGRQGDIEILLASFDRVAKGGTPELVLVSGYSGIGKSSVVNELQPVLVSPRGLFASGKFDQYKRDIPYSTLIQALQSLIRPLLGRSEEHT